MATLTSRSTSAEAVAYYEQMRQEIRDRLDAAIGPFRWNTHPTSFETPCPDDISPSGSVIVFMDPWAFDRPISDADWPRAKEIVIAIVARYGFTDPVVQIDRPGRHEIGVRDPRLDAYYSLGTSSGTSMGTNTGCHRPAGTPTSL